MALKLLTLYTSSDSRPIVSSWILVLHLRMTALVGSRACTGTIYTLMHDLTLHFDDSGLDPPVVCGSPGFQMYKVPVTL